MLDSTATLQVQEVLDTLNDAFASGDVDRITELFATDCYWRDLVAMTWNLKTVEGRDAVADMLTSQMGEVAPGGFAIQDGEIPVEEDGVTTAWITFETKTGRGWGLMRLRDGRIWTLLTSLRELKGFEETRGKRRPMGAKHGADRGTGLLGPVRRFLGAVEPQRWRSVPRLLRGRDGVLQERV